MRQHIRLWVSLGFPVGAFDGSFPVVGLRRERVQACPFRAGLWSAADRADAGNFRLPLLLGLRYAANPAL